MKTFFKLSLVAATALASLASCKEEEVFPASITRELSMTLDGEPWNIYYGTSNLPLFIYNSNGDYYANYSTSFRFSLPDGNYKVFATNQSNYITPPTNINEQVIEQDLEAKQTFAISDPIDYTAGDPMSLALKTRTGMLRLRALDTKADKSYSTIHAIVTTPVVAYHVGEAGPVTGEPIRIDRNKETAGGGVGYTEDMYFIGSETDQVNVTIEYLDADNNVVNTKPFAEGFIIKPNELTEVSFYLNNADEPVIINYDVYVGQLNWRDNDIYPSVKVYVPAGYTYLEPGTNLSTVFTEQMADESIDEIKIFLKAGASYTIADKILEGCTKPFTFLGQTPGFGQQLATLQLVNITMEGNISEIRFENLTLRPTKDRIFNLRNQKFHVGTIAFVNCAINNWSGSIWANTAAADNEQIVDNVIMDNCRLTQISTTGCLWNNTTRNAAPIFNWTFTNTLFHGRNFGTRNAIMTGLSKTTGDITVLVEGCTFIDTRGTDCVYFDIDGAVAASTEVTVRNNTVTGIKSGTGTWFKFGNTSSIEASGNTRTNGFVMKAWGVDAPAESDKTYNDILSQFNL
ncbi:MAG: hypothetical protein K2L77_07280 [Muribaculaceae bacterium]|nr:hypothetical protein [Muribaculaceae bacterium]